MTMIKDALQYVVGLNKAELIQVGDKTYSDKTLYPVKEPMQEELNISTLSSMVRYIQEDPDKVSDNSPFIIHVVDYNKVTLRLPVEKQFSQRPYLLTAECSTRHFKFGVPMNREDFNIALQSQFVRTENAMALLQVIGTMSEDNGVQTQDDGFSQKVTARTGVASLSNVIIPNPLELAPYRTFTEILQPESLFVFRIHEGMRCALYEADGEKWKSDCIKHIKEYFEAELEEHIKERKVVVLG